MQINYNLHAIVPAKLVITQKYYEHIEWWLRGWLEMELYGCFSFTYCAHVKALSKAFKEPPTKGFGGVGSLAIHHPTGILTAFRPFDDKNLKSSLVMYAFQ